MQLDSLEILVFVENVQEEKKTEEERKIRSEKITNRIMQKQDNKKGISKAENNVIIIILERIKITYALIPSKLEPIPTLSTPAILRIWFI